MKGKILEFKDLSSSREMIEHKIPKFMLWFFYFILITLMLTIPRQGDSGTNGGSHGDLIVLIHVEEDQYYEREGNDLYCAIPISFTQAFLGADLDITNLDGNRITVKIPAGTPNGKQIKIKNEGVPVTGTSRKGDLIIKFMVQFPTRLTKDQQVLMQKFEEIENPTKTPTQIPLSSLSH